jgi:hypothetical protein
MKVSGQSFSEMSQKDQELVHNLLDLPKRILKYHDVDGLPQLLLHELSHQNFFNLKKSIYFADNPDFDHLTGVAGCCTSECHMHANDLWQAPEKFPEHMSKALYNGDIQKFLRESLKRRDINFHETRDLEDIGKELGMENPNFISWDMKHGNHGLLLFEHNDETAIDMWRHRMLSNAVAMLSMCPLH